MSFPRRARAASIVFVTLLAAVLVSDVEGLPGCKGGCKAVTATAQAQLLPVAPKPPLLGLAPFDGAEVVRLGGLVVGQQIGERHTVVRAVE